MNKEYEYSFKVNDISPFVEFCKKNNYELEDEYEQIRTLYKNGKTAMARITKNTYPDKSIEVLNFKDDNLNDNILKVSRESKDLEINDENRDFVISLLEILDLDKTKELIRKRYVYKKNNVIFELDEYTSPVMNVVAIEGLKEEVDNVYKELNDSINYEVVE